MRTWLYHADCIEGKIFVDADTDFKKLEQEGWVTSPALINKEATEQKPRTRRAKDGDSKTNN